MKKEIFICVFFVMIGVSQNSFGQQSEGTEAINLTYTSTLDGHSGGLISYESYLGSQLFYTYALGVSQSHYFDWEYVVNFDMGYRFHFNNYRPDVRFGFGYLFGNYNEGAIDAEKEVMGLDEMSAHLTTTLKFGLLNWNLAQRQHFALKLLANIGIQYQYPMNNNVDFKETEPWHLLLETGIGYRFNY